MATLHELPKPKNTKPTWLEAMNTLIEAADEDVKANPVTNVLVLSLDDTDFCAHLLEQTDLVGLIGVMECLKQQFASAVLDLASPEYEDDD
jgi:hypothetical protein